VAFICVCVKLCLYICMQLVLNLLLITIIIYFLRLLQQVISTTQLGLKKEAHIALQNINKMYGCMVYGCMDVWMYGCMDVCMYGFMGVWVYECMGV